MKKILTSAIIAVTILGLCGVVAVKAQDEDGNGFYSVIIQKLAERFNLNPEEVEEVFNEAHEEIRQEIQARFEERAGKEIPKFTQLTDEQKEALSAKREELREKCGDLKDLSVEERQAKMQEIREEMEAWAEENGIDLEFIGLRCGPGFRGPKNDFGPWFGPGFFSEE